MTPLFPLAYKAVKCNPYFLLLFSVKASSVLTRAESSRKLRISHNASIAGVVLGLILTPLMIWYRMQRYNQLTAQMEGNFSDYNH